MDIGEIVALVVAAAGLIIAWRKAPAERRVMSADAAETYQNIALAAAEREQKLQDRITAMETRMEQYENDLKKARADAARFENWARRLSHQLQALGHIPVPLDGEAS